MANNFAAAASRVEPADTTGIRHAGTFRTLTAADIPEFRAHLFRLDEESRRNRFLGVINDDWLAQYPQRCFSTGATVIGYVEDGKVRGVAELHPIHGDASSLAEVAFSVERGYRHHRIGSDLFRRVLAEARGEGIAALRMNCHPQNHGMQALARKFRADITIDRSGTVGHLVTRGAAPLLGGKADARLAAS